MGDHSGSENPREDKSRDRDRIEPAAHLTGVGLDHWGDSFPSTHWSMVFVDREEDGTSSATQRMLERLCTRYWYPLYAYLRKRGHSSHDAQDLTQGFFVKMLEGDGLARADRDRGRFRSYMLGAMNHYLSDVRKHQRAEKRGGGRIPVSIEEELAEQRFRAEPVDRLTPEKLFDREWALALLQGVVDQLGEEYARQGKSNVFDELGAFLTAKPEKGTYPAIAERLGTSEGNVRVMVNRIRKRYQTLLRQAIEETVESPEEVDAELQYLFSVFSEA